MAKITWEQAADEAKIDTLFVKLSNDGDTAVGAFVGDVEMLMKKGFVEGGDDRKVFRINFFVKGERKMLIYECGKKAMQEVLAVRNKYGFNKTWFEISRHGTKGSTSTTYKILPDSGITKEDHTAIIGAELNDLSGERNDDDFPPQ